MLKTTYPAPFHAEQAKFLNWEEIDGDCRARLLADFAYATDGAHLSFAEGIAVREADLPFFPGLRLAAFSIPHLSQDRFYFRDEDGLMFDAPLDGSNAPIYRVAGQRETDFSARTLPDYIRFVFHFVRGDGGSFHVVEKLTDVHWRPHARRKIKHELKELLMPITHQGLETDGMFHNCATVLFKNTLYKTDVLIASKALGNVRLASHEAPGAYLKGETALANEQPLKTDLPVLRLPGIF